MNLTTDHRRPTVIFAVAAVILMAVGVLVVLTTMRFVRDNEWESHTAAVLNKVDALGTLERTAIAAQRGYLLTGEKRLRDDFWESKATLPEQLRTLKGAIQHLPVATLLAEVSPTMEQRIALAANTIDVFDRQGLPAAQAYIQTNGSLEMDVRIQALLDEMRTLQVGLLSARRQAAERSADLLLLAASLGIPLSLFMLAIVYRLLLRENRDRRKSEQAARESEARFRKLSGDMFRSRQTLAEQFADSGAPRGSPTKPQCARTRSAPLWQTANADLPRHGVHQSQSGREVDLDRSRRRDRHANFLCRAERRPPDCIHPGQPRLDLAQGQRWVLSI